MPYDRFSPMHNKNYFMGETVRVTHPLSEYSDTIQKSDPDLLQEPVTLTQPMMDITINIYTEVSKTFQIGCPSVL